MPSHPVPAWFIALVVVRRGDRFLLVHEREHGQRWYLPAGRVEPGERLVDGAVREALEESRVPVVLEGVLRVEHTPGPPARVRVIFVARPADDTAPGPTADSLDAGWFSVDEMAGLELRAEEARRICAHVAAGGAVSPLSVLTAEGALFG